MTEVIRAQGGKETETEYFAALVSARRHNGGCWQPGCAPGGDVLQIHAPGILLLPRCCRAAPGFPVPFPQALGRFGSVQTLFLFPDDHAGGGGHPGVAGCCFLPAQPGAEAVSGESCPCPGRGLALPPQQAGCVVPCVPANLRPFPLQGPEPGAHQEVFGHLQSLHGHRVLAGLQRLHLCPAVGEYWRGSSSSVGLDGR